MPGPEPQPVTLGRIDEPSSTQGPICHAPFASLWLDAEGVVRSCCANHLHPLGKVGEQRLSEIWHGAATAQLRRRLEVGDLGLGCEECAIALRSGDDHAAYLHSYADLPVATADPVWPVQLELSISNVCNLQCVMCDGDRSSMIRRHREGRPPLPEVYDDAFFEDLDAFLPHLERIVFMGGEPFLARPMMRVMERLVELGLTPRCIVITNGTQWNHRIERLLAHLPMHLTLSIDGASAATVESIRVGVDHGELIENFHRYRAAAQRYGHGFEICYALQRANVRELGPFLAWAESVDTPVFIRRVMAPTSMSLHLAPTDELREVVAHADAIDDAVRPLLHRNLHVWDEEMTSLRRVVERRDAETTSAVVVRTGAGPAAVDLEQAALERLAQLGATDGPVIVESDAAYRVVRVRQMGSTPSGWGDLLEQTIGWHMERLAPALSQAWGTLVSSEVDRPDAGSEERILEFEDASGRRTTLFALHVPATEGAGPRWILGRQPDSTPTPV